MKLLQRHHPHAFPQSLTRTMVGNAWKLEANSKPNALTFAEFKVLYAKCGELLHRGTIRTMEAEGQIDKAEYNEVVSWSLKIVDLLNEHVVTRAGGAGMFHISLKTEKGGPACSVFSNFHAGGVQVETYDLDVRQ